MFIIFFLLIVLGSTKWLSPYIDPFLNSYGKYIRIGILILSFATLGLLIFPEFINPKETGEWALELLWILLFIPIFAKVFNQSLAKKFIPWRKELGILMGMLGLVHGLQYFAFGGIITNLFDSNFWIAGFQMPFFVAGFIAVIISTALLVTSNLYSQIKMKKYWKILHRLVYPLLILVILHVAFIKSAKIGQISWEEFIPVIVYFGLKIAEWKRVSFFK